MARALARSKSPRGTYSRYKKRKLVIARTKRFAKGIASDIPTSIKLEYSN